MIYVVAVIIIALLAVPWAIGMREVGGWLYDAWIARRRDKLGRLRRRSTVVLP